MWPLTTPEEWLEEGNPARWKWGMGLAVRCGDGPLGGGGGGRVKAARRVAGRDWEMRTNVQAITEVL